MVKTFLYVKMDGTDRFSTIHKLWVLLSFDHGSRKMELGRVVSGVDTPKLKLRWKNRYHMIVKAIKLYTFVVSRGMIIYILIVEYRTRYAKYMVRKLDID